MHLAIGLGNPGLPYAFTRHNLGHRVIETLSRRMAIALKATQGPCLLGTGYLDDAPVGLARPTTYMNESGRAVAFLRGHLGLSLDEMLIICDDVNLPLGKIRLRRSGSDGGHRGLESIISTLSSADFARLRLGIGFPGEGQDLISYVLEKFEQGEQSLVAEMVELAADATRSCFREGIESTMNRFNT